MSKIYLQIVSTIQNITLLCNNRLYCFAYVLPYAFYFFSVCFYHQILGILFYRACFGVMQKKKTKSVAVVLLPVRVPVRIPSGPKLEPVKGILRSVSSCPNGSHRRPRSVLDHCRRNLLMRGSRKMLRKVGFYSVKLESF